MNKLQDSCELTNCYIRCCECNACVHIFTCTCPHFSIIACSRKHIHLVKRYLFSKNPHSEESEQPVNQYTNNEIMEAFDKIKKNKAENFYDLQRFLSSEVASCSSLDVDAMKHLHQQLLAVTNTFESMVKNKYTPIIDN